MRHGETVDCGKRKSGVCRHRKSERVVYHKCEKFKVLTQTIPHVFLIQNQM